MQASEILCIYYTSVGNMNQLVWCYGLSKYLIWLQTSANLGFVESEVVHQSNVSLAIAHKQAEHLDYTGRVGPPSIIEMHALSHISLALRESL